MKKKYFAPDFEVIKMELGNAILAMSQSDGEGTSIGQVPEKPNAGEGGNVSVDSGGFWDVD